MSDGCVRANHCLLEELWSLQQQKRKAQHASKSQNSGLKLQKQSLLQHVLAPTKPTLTPPSGVANPENRSHLNHLIAAERKKYDEFASHGLILNRYADKKALENIDLWGDVTKVLKGVRWVKLLSFNEPTYVELVYEFLSAFD